MLTLTLILTLSLTLLRTRPSTIPRVLGDADWRPRRRLGRRAGPPAAALAHLYDGRPGDQEARQDQSQTARRAAEAESDEMLRQPGPGCGALSA